MKKKKVSKKQKDARKRNYLKYRIKGAQSVFNLYTHKDVLSITERKDFHEIEKKIKTLLKYWS